MRRKKSFTLIELLVVLVILGFFVAMMVQVFTKGDDQRRFDETRIAMDEIKKAILGSKGAYANGQRQFAGYVADMGGLPVLDDMGTPADPTDDQPRVLWEQGTLPLWQYQGDGSRIWCGWRGPYIEMPSRGDNILRDGWGNPFIFTNGDLVNDSNKTYRCIQPHTAAPANKPPNVTYWEEVSATGEFGKDWGSGNKYSQDAFNITSFGVDGVVEGSEYGEDITITMQQTVCIAPVAGRAKFDASAVDKDKIRIRTYYPSNGIETKKTINGVLDDDGYFRFEHVEGESDGTGRANLSIPVGLRSIIVWEENAPSGNPETDDPNDPQKKLVFIIEPTGNWLGDVEIQ